MTRWTLEKEMDKLRTEGRLKDKEIAGLKERYIEAVNDGAQLKRKIKKCKCPECGFSLEQALKDK